VIELHAKLTNSLQCKVASDDLKEAIELMAFFQALPTQCPVCGHPTILTFRSPDKFKFWGMKCTGPTTHETTFGQKKESGQLFYKENEPWKIVNVNRNRTKSVPR